MPGSYQALHKLLLLFSCSVMSNSLWPHRLKPARLLCLWDFPGENTGVGCYFLLQGIFLTQGSNLHFLHWEADSLPLSHQGSPLHSLIVHKRFYFWRDLLQDNSVFSTSYRLSLFKTFIFPSSSVTIVSKTQATALLGNYSVSWDTWNFYLEKC